MELAKFVQEALEQIVRGVVASSEAITKSGGAVSPKFNPSPTGNQLGWGNDNVPVYGVTFDVALSATTTSGTDKNETLRVANAAEVSNGSNEATRAESISRIRFIVPLQLPTDRATAEVAAAKRQREDEAVSRANRSNPYA